MYGHCSAYGLKRTYFFPDDSDCAEVIGPEDGAAPAASDRDILPEHHSAQVFHHAIPKFKSGVDCKS